MRSIRIDEGEPGTGDLVIIRLRDGRMRCELRPNVKTDFPTGLRNFFPGIYYPANGRGCSDTNDWYASSGVG